MNKRQSGFSVLEIILIVAVLGLIGAVAWLFVNNAKTATNDKTAKSDTSNTTTETKKDSKSEWYTYSPAGKQYSIKVADGWTLHTKQGDDASLYSTGTLAIKNGTRGTVVTAVGDIKPCDTFVLDYLPYIAKDEYAATGSLKTDLGIEVKTSKSKDELGISGGGLTYSYHVEKDGKTINMTYTQCAESADEHETVEDVVRTLQLN